MIKNQRDLTYSILIIAFPAIVEMVLNMMLQIVDTIMISRMVGVEGLAAVGFVNQFIVSIIFVFSSFNIGALAMISRFYGEQNMEKVNRVLGQNILINLVIGFFLFMTLFTFANGILRIFSLSGKVHGMAFVYLRILSIGMIFELFSYGSKASLRGVSNTRTPMMITALINGVNIIGNYILIKGVWIFPALGIKGAALSTTASRLTGALIFFIIFLRGQRPLKLQFAYLRLTKDIFRPLLRLSTSAGVEQAIMRIAMISINVIVSQLNTVAEGAYRIVWNIESMSFMPSVGLSLASGALVGKALGEKDKRKARSTALISSSLGISWALLMSLAFIFIPRPILWIFTEDPEIIKACLPAMKAIALNQPVLALWLVMSHSLKGAGDTKTVMQVSTLRSVILLLPLSYLYILILGWGISGFWLADFTSFALFNLFLLLRFFRMKWADIKL